jgi:hypothetical protein
MATPATARNGRSPTVADLAEVKRLPAEFLRDLGLSDSPNIGVNFPYYDMTHRQIAVKRRTALKATEGSYWPKGRPLAAYGQERLDAAAKVGFLILVEGESDCWVLWYHDLPAVGIPGANAVKTLQREHVEAVGIIYVQREPDNGGEIFVEGVRKRLAALGWQGKLFELRMPDGIKDLADLHVADPEQFKERLAEAIRVSTPLPLPRFFERDGKPDKNASESHGLLTTGLDTIHPIPVRWLVPGYLPLGKLVIIAGDGGQGKSTLTLDLTACLTTGRRCFGLGYEPPPPAHVLLISCEDDYADTVVPRLLCAGADLQRVRRVDGKRTNDGRTIPFCLADFQSLEEELAARPDVRLVVIDPAGAYVGRTDDYNDSELRALLGPLAELAARRGVTILLVKHLVKGTTARAVHKVSGSAGYVNAVRAAFVVAPDPDDGDKKLLLPLKINLGVWPRGLAFRTRSLDPQEQRAILDGYGAHLNTTDREQFASQLSRIAWQGPVDADADRVLSEQARRERSTVKVLDKAAEWLAAYLADRPRESLNCVEAGNGALNLQRRLDWWRDSVLKARLGGKPRKTGFGDGQRWWFTLPTHPWPFVGLEEPEEPEEPEERNADSDPSQSVSLSGSPKESLGEVPSASSVSSVSSVSSRAEPGSPRPSSPGPKSGSSEELPQESRPGSSVSSVSSRMEASSPANSGLAVSLEAEG